MNEWQRARHKELKQFIDESQAQHRHLRDALNYKLPDEQTMRDIVAVERLKNRQQLESLGRWIIDKCLKAGAK